MSQDEITVSSPLLPPLEDFRRCLEDIWKSRWVTNNGSYLQAFERALSDCLGVPYLSVLTNGTLPLVLSLKALGIQGEVITTPYSFTATANAILWSGCEPVFADIDPRTLTLSPEAVEAAVTPRTRAILPVHVYGMPCDTAGLRDVAERHGLKIIYDAAHAFGVRKEDRSILAEGDMSTLSLHATKVFNTLEGGAVVSPDAATKRRIDMLRNFGFTDETHVELAGINCKMDEMRAAFGLLNLRMLEGALQRRREVAGRYREAIKDIPGISCLDCPDGVQPNYSHFPVFIDSAEYGEDRDSLYARLKACGIHGRRYFYPLISALKPFRNLASAAEENLPVACSAADKVICLPMHHNLSDSDVDRIISELSVHSHGNDR